MQTTENPQPKVCEMVHDNTFERARRLHGYLHGRGLITQICYFSYLHYDQQEYVAQLFDDVVAATSTIGKIGVLCNYVNKNRFYDQKDDLAIMSDIITLVKEWDYITNTKFSLEIDRQSRDFYEGKRTTPYDQYEVRKI